jgi:hypothetical protein
MKTTVVNNIPHASTLINGLRNGHYDLESALADLIDNSIDAGATFVKISLGVNKHNKPYFYLADDGVGIPSNRLQDCMNIASPRTMRSLSDLGKFGMGLCTASMYLGDKLTVTTKVAGQPVYAGLNDYAKMIKNDDYLYTQSSDPSDEKFFKRTLDNVQSGTIVSIEDIRLIQAIQLIPQSDTLIETLSTIFCKKLEAGFVIQIDVMQQGWKKLEPINPLNVARSKVLKENTMTCNFLGKSFPVHYRLIEIPNDSPELTMKTSGFYLFRNDRLLSSAETLGLFTRHNEFNKFRAEINFSAEADEFFGVSHTKRSVTLSSEAKAQLAAELKDDLTKIWTRRERHSDEFLDKLNSDFSKILWMNKDELLPNVFGSDVEKRESKKSKSSNLDVAEVVEAESKDNKPRLVSAKSLFNHPKIQIADSTSDTFDNYFDYSLTTELNIIFYCNHPIYKAVKKDAKAQAVLRLTAITQILSFINMPEEEMNREEWISLSQGIMKAANQKLGAILKKI